MAHANQERWSKLVDAKLRNQLVTRDNYIFNNRYEGDPKAGKVKIPVRDTEVSVKDYNKATGIDPEAGTTTYLELNIDQDEAVNELIDGFDAASVPDGIVADRLDSAGYSLGLSIDKKSIEALQAASGATISATKTAATEANAYKLALEAKRVLSRKGVPADGRFMIVSPEYLEVLMLDEPSMGLAPILVEQIFDIIREFHAAGTTILLVEQNAGKALAVADRAYVLEQGRITLSGTGADLAASDAVKKAYLGG